MRKLITLSIFILFVQISSGQDTIRHFEFGLTLLTVNSFRPNNSLAFDRPQIEYINSLFIRYNKKRLGFRAQAGYSEYSLSFSSPPKTADGAGSDVYSKDLRIGIGGQFSILKNKDWIYTCLDLSYRNVFSTGHFRGGITGANDKLTFSSNGLDSFLGLGFKIKVFKNLFLSPEIGYYSSTKFVNKTTTSLKSEQFSRDNYFETNIDPTVKLHLLFKF